MRNKHIFNKNYFSKPTLKNSYWAGFIAADGCIVDKNHTKNCSKVLDIRLNKRDISLLKAFKKDLKSNARIYRYGDVAEVKVVSNDIALALNKNFNITPRKSLTLKPPKNLTNKQALAYIKGYIDGDGWITIPKTPYKNGNYYLILGILGTKKFLKWVNFVLDYNFNIGIKRISKIDNIYKITLSSKQAEKVLFYLSNLKTFNLKRKWNKLKEI